VAYTGLLQAPQLLSKYNNSVAKILQTEYPERAWKPWKFSSAPFGWFEEVRKLAGEDDWVAKTALQKYLEDTFKENDLPFTAAINQTMLPAADQARVRFLGGLKSVFELAALKVRLQSHDDDDNPSSSPQEKLIFVSSKLMQA